MSVGSIAVAQHSGKPTPPSTPPAQNQSNTTPTQPKQDAAPEVPEKTPEERATAHTKILTQKLGLNADQQKSVHEFCLKRAQQDDADKIKFKTDKDGMKNARRLNGETFEKNIDTLLTPDQKTKYEQYKQDEKDKRQKKVDEAKDTKKK